MGFLYSSYKELNVIQEKAVRFKTYALGVQASLIGFCAAAFFLSRTYIIIPYLMFAMAGSLMYIATQQDQTVTLEWTKKDWMNVFWLSVGVVVMVYIAVKGAL